MNAVEKEGLKRIFWIVAGILAIVYMIAVAA